MPVSTGLLTLSTDLALDTLMVCTGPSTGNTESLYWAIYWVGWLCVVGPLLDRLLLSTGPSTGLIDAVYWTLYWTYHIVYWALYWAYWACLLGPWDFTPLFSGCLAFGAWGGWACTMTHLLSVGCVYTKSMWPAHWWQPFSINAGNFFLFLISLCFFASFF